ncbi:N-6 DNA methylase [Streptomyces sp. VNUA74]|uniref:class I SAM-dependent DNA methyltransferase n=1 Tax=Streptomyces sp. VNUA74 TaxID=3062685 RepID=UPI00280C051C|nr:N-6 DNA methylase [Streptomyces sp. VNUA74]WML81819.1 N-6 DNA methylase [Streptomyces sp. VNUA74]
MTDLLRGGLKGSQYGRVVLPFTVLRRMDCLRRNDADRRLAANAGEVTGDLVSDGASTVAIGHSQVPVDQGEGNSAAADSGGAAGSGEDASSPDAPDDLAGLLLAVDDEASPDDELLLAEAVDRFVRDFPAAVVDVLESFEFASAIRQLADARVLRQVVSRFAEMDLSPSTVSDQEMGREYEELVRRVTEASPETTAEHTSPQDVSVLTARLLLGPDAAALTPSGTSITVYDPCCGTGGMLSAVEGFLNELGGSSKVSVSGQEINLETYAIARSLRMMRGADPSGIAHGNVLTDDRHQGETFDYLLAAPPNGLDWKRQHDEVKREATELGFAGRFGAGLPRVNDSSLLFVQHLVAHMRPAGQGGARAAILFTASSLQSGGAGSGESGIRRWLLENDLLEGVVALPPYLLPNIGVPMYLWVLSNRKPLQLRGMVIALDARGHTATLRRPLGGKRHYLTDQHIARIAERYEAAYGDMSEGSPEVGGEDGAVLLDAQDLVYQEVTVNWPLRQHFTVSADIAADVESSKMLARFDEALALLRALRAVTGQTWPTRGEFESAFSTALKNAGLSTELPRSLWDRVRKAVAVSDPGGEVQTDERGVTLPDPDLAHRVRVPLEQNVADFVRREVAPGHPDAWPDLDSVKIGCVLPQAPFLVSGPGTGFGPLSTVARRVSRWLGQRATEGLPLLRGTDLQTAVTAADLPEASGTGQALAVCTGGDVVGQAGNWRLLPPDFGDAVTQLTVLRPLGNSGRALCEWLRTRAGEEGGAYPRISMNSPVPVELIRDSEFNSLLDDLDGGKEALARTTSRILPNVFRDPQAGLDEMRRTAKASAYEARIIGELVQPLGDPVWRAEWSYPYHVAALARQYRIATTLAQRKDALLKLAESVARCVGVLALAVRIHRRQSFDDTLRGPFKKGGGATFWTWQSQISDLVKDGPVPELPELEGALDSDGVFTLLDQIRGMRNDSSHASRVQPEHELEREVSVLEPVVVSTLESVGWLSGLHWDLVDTCAYTGNGGFTLIGRRLRGSHPDWEPFERPYPGPVEPNRIYVQSPSSAQPLTLWPIARAEVCTECDARELFLLHKIDRTSGAITLRCGRDHTFPRDSA